MGYTEHNTSFMIGLDTSAISDIGTAYAQNVKKVEHYITLVNSGKLPVFKGHMMLESEQEIRTRILYIICHGWITGEDINQLDETRRLSLMEMIDEDLLTIDWKDLKVTEKGLKFLRNICALFDPGYVYDDQKQTFSQSV